MIYCEPGCSQLPLRPRHAAWTAGLSLRLLTHSDLLGGTRRGSLSVECTRVPFPTSSRCENRLAIRLFSSKPSKSVHRHIRYSRPAAYSRTDISCLSCVRACRVLAGRIAESGTRFFAFPWTRLPHCLHQARNAAACTASGRAECVS